MCSISATDGVLENMHYETVKDQSQYTCDYDVNSIGL